MIYKMQQANELLRVLDHLSKEREEALKRLGELRNPESSDTHRLREIEKRIEEIRRAMKFFL